MKKILSTTIFLLSMFIFTSIAHADITDCKNGYKFSPRSGVGCQQINCNEIPDAHYSYTGYCICGTSGSINEKATDPNKECSYPSDYESCPSCLYACVHLDEECPNEITDSNSVPELNNPPPTQIEIPTASANPPQPVGAPPTTNPTPQPATTNLSAGGIIPTPTATANTGMTCQKFCGRLTRGGTFDDVLIAEGTYPVCKCTIDNKDDSNRLTETITINGDTRTTYTYDPTTGELIKKNTISMMAEKERIREMLGFKYDEDQIDQMLSDEVINDWFANKMSNIETQANMFHAQFWWQHMVALWDHGYGNSTEFVDTYNFGRCGDSMMWLEQNLADDLKLNGKHDKRSEAMLSITGEKYGNLINHTALIIRPTGYSNIAWGDMVQELMDKTRKGGLSKLDIQGIDPKLLDAKVLDPYFKKTMTVREFIKGWSVIKIS
jgi:hypothetical protein